MEIIFILDPTHRVNFPPKGETPDLPDQREKLPGLCHPGYQTGWGGQSSCQTLDTAILWLHMAKDYHHFLSKKRKRIIIKMFLVAYTEYLPHTGSITYSSATAGSYCYPYFKKEEIGAQKS